MRPIMYAPLILLLCIVASCEYAATYSYKIHNTSGSRVKIVAKQFNYRDTVVYINPGDEATLFVVNAGVGGPRPDFESKDSLVSVTRIWVYKNDTQASKTAFRNRSLWTYELAGRHSANFTATIMDSDL